MQLFGAQSPSIPCVQVIIHNSSNLQLSMIKYDCPKMIISDPKLLKLKIVIKNPEIKFKVLVNTT